MQKQPNARVVLILGCPGSGKSTQAVKLAAHLGQNTACISTGDLVRNELAENPQGSLATVLNHHLKAGTCAPADITDGVFAKRLLQPDCQPTSDDYSGIVLEGYPRQFDQIEPAAALLRKCGVHPVQAVVFLKIADGQVAYNRIAARAADGATARADDDVAWERVKSFAERSEPLIRHFYERDLLVEVDAAQGVDEVAEQVWRGLLAREHGEVALPLTPAEELRTALEAGNGLVSDAAVQRFRDRSLLDNKSNATGVMRRWVYVITANERKLSEFRLMMQTYGLETLQLLPIDWDDLACRCLPSADLLVLAQQQVTNGKLPRFGVPAPGITSSANCSSHALKPNPSKLHAAFPLSGNHSPAVEQVGMFASDSDHGEAQPVRCASAGSSATVADMDELSTIELPNQNGVSLTGAQLQGLLIRQLLMCRVLGKLVPFAVIREESMLFAPPAFEGDILEIPSSQRDGVHVVNRAEMTVWRRDATTRNVAITRYVTRTTGRIAQDRRDPDDPAVFGWDDVFVPRGLDLTFHELHLRGLKVSARQSDIAHFLQDFIYYPSARDLRWNPQHPSRCVDFDIDPHVVLQSMAYVSNQEVQRRGCTAMLCFALANGMYFRFPFNRRHVNYFCTPVAGIPATPKDDETHEEVFQAHDIGHLAILEALYTGEDSKVERDAYIAYRMLSEAMTMIYADMFVADAIIKGGVIPRNYPGWDKRRIYVLFEATGLKFDGTDQERRTNLLTLMHANADCLMKGDDSAFEKLIDANGGDHNTLTRFKEKYAPFFTEDFKWSHANWNKLRAHSDRVRRWWLDTAEIRDKSELVFESTTDFVDSIQQRIGSSTDIRALSASKFVDEALDLLFDRQIASNFDAAHTKGAAGGPLRIPPRWLRGSRAFIRYMVGQMSVFSTFAFVPEAAESQRKTNAIVLDVIEKMHVWKCSESNSSTGSVGCAEHELPESDQHWQYVRAKIGEARGEVERFLACLVDLRLISRDDEETYKESFPLFSVFYTSYDRDEQYEPMSVVFERQFSAEERENLMLQEYEQSTHAKLAMQSERHFVRKMQALVESTGGVIDAGAFVSRPGVTLMAHSVTCSPAYLVHGNNPAMMSASFCVAGVSVETAMEFVAHGEGSVARLTSSRTAAMSHPLYRVLQFSDPENVKLYLSQMLRRSNRLRAALLRPGGHASIPAANTQQGLTASAGAGIVADPGPAFGRGAHEVDNNAAPASKATAFLITMTLADWHNTFLGRCSREGNEADVVDVACSMADQLHALYPQFIRSSTSYKVADNTEKYRPFSVVNNANVSANASSPSAAVETVSELKLTREALRVFRACRMDLSDHREPTDLLAEFAMRITYLSFPNAVVADYDGKVWISDMIAKTGHHSVLGVSRVTVAIHPDMLGVEVSESSLIWLKRTSATLGGLVEDVSIGNEKQALLASFNIKRWGMLLSRGSAAPDKGAVSLCRAVRNCLDRHYGQYFPANVTDKE